MEKNGMNTIEKRASFIKEYIVPIAGFLIAAGVFYAGLGSADREAIHLIELTNNRVYAVEQRMDADDKEEKEILERLTRVEANTEAIKESVTRLEKLLERVIK